MLSSHHHDPSSSVNSADAGSHHGTPETKLTALSPEECQSNHVSTVQDVLRSNQPPSFSLEAVPTKGVLKGNLIKSTTAGYQDPFVISSPGFGSAASNEPPKLSAVAPSFTPLGLAENTGGNIVSHTLTVPVNGSSAPRMYSPGRHLSVPLMPETPYSQESFEGHLSPVASRTLRSYSNQTSPSSMRSPGLERQQMKSGQFSSDSQISRSMMISQIDRCTPTAHLENIISPHTFKSRKDLVLENLSLSGTAYASFTDIRDAIQAMAALQGLRNDWAVQYVPTPLHRPYSKDHQHSSSWSSEYEGQILVKAEFSGPPIYFDLDTVSRLILDLLHNYGSMMAYDAVITVHPVVAYRAEFFDTKDADHAIAHLNGFRIALDLEANGAAWSTPSQRSPLSSPYHFPSPTLTGSLTPNFFHTPHERRVMDYVMQESGGGSLLSPNLRSYPASGIRTPSWGAFNTTPYGPGAIGQERNLPTSPFNSGHHPPRPSLGHGGRHAREFSGGHHNIVDVDRIRQGADVRTTVCRPLPVRCYSK
ncbi:MAG: hypothetical protein Q9170_006408 [Blastenia crenularia]